MIKEKSSYTNGLPVNIRIAEIEEYPLHFHQDIEFVYVLKGEINLKCGYFTYRIAEGNVFTINGREVHGLYRTDQENMVALVQIDNYYFSHYFNRLSGSCFRTFTSDKDDERLDALRQFFANILLESLKKEPGYKQQISDMIVKLLEYLNEYFHYFSFENKMVVNARNDNPLIVERLGRIINFIYENHTRKITLEDLSTLEHLSTYYISHLITEGTGMNFREFLCFARVEFSEMLLLDTDKKINVIAQEVGFSATSYYIKYFKKWFGMCPEEYRQKYQRDTKAPGIPAKLNAADPGAVSKILHRLLDVLSRQNKETTPAGSRSFALEYHVDCKAEPIGSLNAAFIPRCKASVLKDRIDAISGIAKDLSITEIRIVSNGEGVPENVIERLRREGIGCKEEISSASRKGQFYGMDSIAAASYILKQGLSPGCREITVNSLIDSNDGPTLLKGEDGIFTAGMVPKPSYFAYKMLQHMQGDLIHWGKYHAVIKKTSDSSNAESYCIVCYNHNEEIENLCKRPSSLEETQEQIGRLKESVDISLHLNGIYGTHQIIIYRLCPENSLLAYVVNHGHNRGISDEESSVLQWATSPKADISTETLTGTIFFNTTLRGLEAQCVMIKAV